MSVKTEELSELLAKTAEESLFNRVRRLCCLTRPFGHIYRTVEGAESCVICGKTLNWEDGAAYGRSLSDYYASGRLRAVRKLDKKCTKLKKKVLDHPELAPYLELNHQY